MQLCGSLNILGHCPSLGLEWKLTFSSPVATAEFSKFTGILSEAQCILRVWYVISSGETVFITVVLARTLLPHFALIVRWKTDSGIQQESNQSSKKLLCPCLGTTWGQRRKQNSAESHRSGSGGGAGAGWAWPRGWDSPLLRFLSVATPRAAAQSFLLWDPDTGPPKTLWHHLSHQCSRPRGNSAYLWRN